jgi:ABC-type uncharacterized transport system substrate-binding protein
MSGIIIAKQIPEAWFLTKSGGKMMSGKEAPSSKFAALTCAFIAAFLFFTCPAAANEEPTAALSAGKAADGGIRTSARKWKILHIMSYHSPWEWTDDQLHGFKDALSGVDIEYKIFQMDTKRNSSREWKEQVGKEARELIESWKPDLVYTTDDYAQQYVAAYYVNKSIPFVCGGVNGDPQSYRIAGSTNITGVLEREHFVETVNLLREIVPGVRKIAVIVDPDPTWIGVIHRMQKKAAVELPDMEFVSWDIIRTFDEYKAKVTEYQKKVDGLALLGIHAFTDREGRNVPWQDVLKWTAEQSRLPDFSFWKDRILFGTLCAVYVSGYEQGRAAGSIARGILTEGKKVSDYPMQPTVKGEPIVSLARAKLLGIRIGSEILLSSRVVEKLEWEK